MVFFGSGTKMNIILVISDTLRKDHLGCYGNERIRTPNIDRFAKECIQFENCYAASFPTLNMRADLYTGKFTFTQFDWGPFPKNEKPLAQILAESGYNTLAVVDVPFLQRYGYGYDRGFHDYIFIYGQDRLAGRERIEYERRYEEDLFAPRTMAAAEKLVELYRRSKRKEKLFLYVDTWDPHEPWEPPPWYVEPYYPNYQGQKSPAACYWNWRERGVKEEDIRLAHACYCGEITMVDRWFGRLLDRVKSIGLWESTAIIFTSDHGYYFGEHGFFGKLRLRNPAEHTTSRAGADQSPLFQEITRVPLLVYVPGVKPRKVEALVSVVDIMPTILELAGVEIPKTVQGKSLLPLMRGEEDAFRDFAVTSTFLYYPGEPSRIVDDWVRPVEKPHFSTITTSEWTLLCSTEDSPAYLYNLKNDPKESQNVIDKNWDVAEHLHQKFVKFLEESGTEESRLAPRRKLSREYSDRPPGSEPL